MGFWKKDRNYRKHIKADGSVSHIITVDGIEVEVSPEVYHAYAQADRRERYCYERKAGLLLSLEHLGEDGAWIPHLWEQCVESAEDTVIREMMIAHMMDALTLLCPEERELLEQLFGRLIRTETDTGVCAILDCRACEGAAYHSRVLSALPPCRATSSVLDVARFMREKKSPAYFEEETLCTAA